MSPGTKVICVNVSVRPEAILSVLQCFQTWVKQDKIYTVRELLENNGIVEGVLLEEISNKPIYIKLIDKVQEPAFGLFRFRELSEDELEALELLDESIIDEELELIDVNEVVY